MLYDAKDANLVIFYRSEICSVPTHIQEVGHIELQVIAIGNFQ